MRDKGLVQAVLSDYRTATLSETEKALFEFMEKVNDRSFEITREEVEQLRVVGWSDEALYDAITVCALFNFYNRWCDAAGVHDMAAEEYEKAGKRLASHGYLPPE